MSHIKPDAFALLIGINDYSAYDASAGLAPKTSDLRGAVHDVQHYWRMMRAAGLPAANIRIALAPTHTVPPNAFKGANRTGATLADIEAGLDWLASKLDTPKVSGGVVSVSTHGSYDARGSLICASDTQLSGDALSGVLPMSDVFKRLDGRAKATPVTIFLDACDAGGGTPGNGTDRGRALRGRAAGATRTAELPRRPDDLLLAASAPGSESYEIAVDDSIRGAFSWAAMAVLERWGLHRTATDTHFDISYADLRARVDHLLAAMKVEQRTHFDGTPAAHACKVFAELASIEKGVGDQPFFSGGREVSPGLNGYVRKYKVKLHENGSSTLKAYLYAPGTGCGDWKSSMMYWQDENGWSDFYAALGSLSAQQAVMILFVADIKVGSLSMDPSTLTPYESGTAWISLAAPSLASTAVYGTFQRSGKTCFLCADADGRLVWLLDKTVSPPTSGWLIDDTSANDHLYINFTTSQPTSGTHYFEADDA